MSEPIRVLVADTDPDVTDRLESALVDYDNPIELLSASTCADAHTSLGSHSIDCLVFDTTFPDGTGFELLDAVHSHNPSATTILFTEEYTSTVLGSVIDADIDAFVPKSDPDAERKLAGQVVESITPSGPRLLDRLDTPHVLEHLADGVLILDGDWCITFANDVARDALDIGRSSVGTVSLWDIVPEAQGTDIHDRFRHVRSTGESISTEYYFEPWDRWYRVHLFPIGSGLTIAYRDITSEQERELALENANSQLEAAIEAANVGTWEWDIQTDTLTMDPTFAQTFGVDIEHARDGVELDQFVSSIHDLDRDRVLTRIEQAIEECGTYDTEYRVRTDSGDIRWVNARGHVECDDDGTPLTFPGALIDITEQKVAEEQITVLNRVLRHNLRNELTVIRGQLIESIEGRDDTPARLQTAVDGIDNLVDISEKVRRLISYTDNELPPTEVSLEALIESTIDDVAEEHPPTSVHISGDATVQSYPSLELALYELIENALKHAGEGPAIDVSIESTDDGVTITIEDNGPGLPEPEQRILETKTETPLVHGSGLGLWIAEWITTNHGGTLDVDASSDGTSVILHLPREPPDPIERQPPASVSPDSSLNERYRALFEESPDAMLIVNESGRIGDANESASVLFESDRHGLVGRNVESLLGEIEWSPSGRSATERSTTTFETADGDRVVEYTIIQDIMVDRYFVVIRDITQRKRREEELETVKRRMDAILENTTAPMFLKADTGEYIVVNQEYRALFDLEDTPVAGLTDYDLHPPHVADAVSANDTMVIEQGDPIKVEEQVEVDGETRVYLSTKVPVYDIGDRRDPDRPVAVFGVATDITDRKTHEQKLEALTSTTRGLMTATSREEVARIGVEAAREVLGLSANSIHLYDDEQGNLVPVATSGDIEDLVGNPPTLTPGDSIAWRAYADGESLALDDVRADADVLNPDTSIKSELYLPLGEFGILISSSSDTEAFQPQDRLLGELLARNITGALEQVETLEKIQAREAELSRQNERLDEFAGVVSHDLRNPLNVAAGRLELAQDDCESEHLYHIEDALERMETLIDELLTLAREGRQVDEVSPVELSHLVDRCWSSVSHPDATFHNRTSQSIMADESRLQQLLENLFRNAIHHSGPDVTVTVGDIPSGFFVEDDGDGIDDALRDDIFETGFTTAEDGTGFGLSIVQQIAHAHGWHIDVTDSDAGGARFEIAGVDYPD